MLVGKEYVERSNQWQDILSQLDVTGEPTSWCTVSDVAAFEQALGRPLPDAYRSYCVTFGSGEFSDEIKVFCPCRSKAGIDAAEFNRQQSSLVAAILEEETQRRNAGRSSFLSRSQCELLEGLAANMLVFGDTASAALFAWDLRTYNATDGSYDIWSFNGLFDHHLDIRMIGRDFGAFGTFGCRPCTSGCCFQRRQVILDRRKHFGVLCVTASAPRIY